MFRRNAPGYALDPSELRRLSGPRKDVFGRYFEFLIPHPVPSVAIGARTLRGRSSSPSGDVLPPRTDERRIRRKGDPPHSLDGDRGRWDFRISVRRDWPKPSPTGAWLPSEFPRPPAPGRWAIRRHETIDPARRKHSSTAMGIRFRIRADLAPDRLVGQQQPHSVRGRLDVVSCAATRIAYIIIDRK